MPRYPKFEKPPTGFNHCFEAHPEWTDKMIAEETLKLDPENGICLRTVRRIRYGERSDSKGIYLLMCVTGLAFPDFIATSFLKRVGERQ